MTWNHNSTDFVNLGPDRTDPEATHGAGPNRPKYEKGPNQVAQNPRPKHFTDHELWSHPDIPDHRCPPTTDLPCVKDGIQRYNLIDMVVHEWLKKCSKSGCVHNLRFFELYLLYFVSTFYIKVFLLYLFIQTFVIRFHKLRVDYISAFPIGLTILTARKKVFWIKFVDSLLIAIIFFR